MANSNDEFLARHAQIVFGRLPNDWQCLRVGDLELKGAIADVQDGNHGESHPKSSDFVPSGVPFIMASDLGGNRINLLHCAFICREQADRLRIGFSKPGDVLLTHKATMGRVAIVPEGHDYVMLTPQVTYYRIGDPKQLDRQFLKWAFLSPRFQAQLNSSSDQSTRKFIGITAQRDLWLPVPPIEQQRAIARVLDSLDDKIELNRRMNETLEAMARAVFKSWFVDFDPVRAKMDGRKPVGMDRATAALFPNSFEDSPLGKIPSGWRIASVSDIAEMNGWTLGRNDLLDRVSYIEISEVMRGDVHNVVDYDRGDEPSRARRRLRHGDTVLSTVRPDRGAYFLCLNPPHTLIASTGFAVLTPRRVPLSFLYAAVARQDVLDELGRLADGGAYPAVRPEAVSALEFVAPDNQTILERFHAVCMPLLERAAHDRRESRSLTSIRDALLPKLLSGKIECLHRSKEECI